MLLTTSLVLAVLTQESSLRYDSGQIVLEAHEPYIKRLLHLDADGFPDAIGLRIDGGGTGQPDRSFFGVYFGDGAGGFERLWTVGIDVPYSSLDDPIAAGDFDGDGDMDFAAAVSDGLYVFLCDGRNQPVVQPVITLAGSSAVDLEVADLDGDGRDDLVALTTSFSGRRINVHLSPATWTAATAQSFIVPGNPGAMALYERGGLPHAAVSYSTTVANHFITLQEFELSSGQPLYVQTYAIPELGGSQAAPELGGGDVDGDGDDDLVAFLGGGDYFLLRSNGSVLTAEPKQPGGPATHLFDIDQDGDLDGVCCGGSTDPNPSFHTWNSAWEISLNDGTGNFQDAFAIDGVAGNGWAGAGDVDGDGDLDLVAGRTVYFDRGDHYATGSTTGLVIKSSTGGIADADGDGDLDLNVALQSYPLPSYFQNDGAGNYEYTVCPTIGVPAGWAAPNTAGVGDYDGDGDLDTVINFYFQPGVRSSVLATNVAGTFTYAPASMPQALDTLYAGQRALSFDWDADGDVDIVHSDTNVGATTQSFHTKVFLNDGAGEFTPGDTFSMTAIVAREDLDGDGLEDFLVVGAGGLGVRLALSQGGWGPLSPMPVVAWPNASVAIADFDEDGDLDVAAFQADGESPVIFVNDGAASFTAETTALPVQVHLQNGFVLGWHATDFDGDGRQDLVLTPGPSGANTAILYRNDVAGALGFTEDVQQVLASRTLIDVDLDGDEDFFGARVHRSLLFDAVEGGSCLQYGDRTAGSGGFEPRLGVSASLDAASYIRFHVSGVRGGALTHFAFGLVPAELSNFLGAGVTAYLSPAHATTLVFPMPGPPLDGAGAISVPFYAPPGIAGYTFYHQVFANDPGAPGGLSTSNALRVTYGTL